VNNPRALIVEDDRDVAAFFVAGIDSADYEVDVAYDGRVALEKLQSAPPDLVVLDLNLPDISGQQILTFMRSDERLKDTWVIVVTGTGYALDDEMRRLANFTLTKPIDTEQLLSIARRIRASYSE